MSALDELLAALRQAVSQAQAARADMSLALDRWDERGNTLEWWLSGTADPDAQGVLATHQATAEELRVAWQQVGAAVEVIERYISDLEAVGAASGGGMGGGSASKPSAPLPQAPPPITNHHGDAYPPEAAGLIEQLPPRVTPGAGNRTVGVIRLGDRLIPPMSSGEHPFWSPKVTDRLDSMGIKADFLAAHVEMQLAEMMRDTSTANAEVAINYTPCGYERQRALPDTCHRVLEDYLPEGYNLTVYGTDRNNQPFRHTYRGRGQA